MSAPFTISSFPSAILHLDADAFFASVEQAVNPSLKGRPVVTGKERGMVSCASYEAKAMGVQRCMPFFKAKQLCPGLVILPGDYETYSLFSKRMFVIMRRYSPLVEEYSIDEGFTDLAGLRRLFRASYEQIAEQIRKKIHEELDITVSAGLSLSKSLAKLASRFRKPDGFTAVEGRHIHLFLQRTPLEKVWGFGPNTVNLLAKHGLKTAYDFATRSEEWAGRLLGKPGREIWNELRGNAINPVNPNPAPAHVSISKCKTFTPPSSERGFVYAVLVRNAESAFIKLRRHKLKTGFITVILRDRHYGQTGIEATLNRPTASIQEAMPLIGKMFSHLFKEGIKYRSAMIILTKIEEGGLDQYELFEDRIRIEKLARAARAVDEINGRFGKHTITLAPALLLNNREEKSERARQPARKTALVKGETGRRQLNLPMLFLNPALIRSGCNPPLQVQCNE